MLPINYAIRRCIESLGNIIVTMPKNQQEHTMKSILRYGWKNSVPTHTTPVCWTEDMKKQSPCNTNIFKVHLIPCYVPTAKIV